MRGISTFQAKGSALVARRTVRPSARHHLTHAGPPSVATAPIETGPRSPLQLGLDAAKASQNVLRLLESSHGALASYGDASSSAWHPMGSRWTYDDGTDTDPGAGWVCSHYDEVDRPRPSVGAAVAPSLAWLNFSDDRTALARLKGVDGLERYVSLLRLEPDAKTRRAQSIPSNDGWSIVREVVQGGTGGAPGEGGPSIESLVPVLREYLSIEHGGGSADALRARELFAPGASLLSVGTSSPDDEPTAWSSPSGSLLHVPLDTYLEGVESQTPHAEEAVSHDRIVQLDAMGSAAAATVHVGNGARTMLFVDHLLLGHHGGRWRILSKVFSPRPFPE